MAFRRDVAFMHEVGLMGIQVDAAVALGYDPAHLTGYQREEITHSLDDPRQSIIVNAARVLTDAKDASDFAGLDPRHMTDRIRAFAGFAADQYQDAGALLAALSNKVKEAGTAAPEQR